MEVTWEHANMDGGITLGFDEAVFDQVCMVHIIYVVLNSR